MGYGFPLQPTESSRIPTRVTKGVPCHMFSLTLHCHLFTFISTNRKTESIASLQGTV